jgi:hypothetical protein
MIEQLITTLEQKIEDLTAEEIADILWLALQQWQSASLIPESQPVEGSSAQPEVEILPPDNTLLPPPTSVPPPSDVSQQSPMAGLTTQRPQRLSQSQSAPDLGAPLAIPDAPSLRRSLDILQALRPLIRLVPSAEKQYLDIPATVKAVAETDLWLLKLRPMLEPWLELALVVDATPSMVIWQRTILNFRRVLSQSGVFRDVRLWGINLSRKSICV